MNTINEPHEGQRGRSPQFRIYWRVGANGQPHRSDGVFGRDVAELWVGSLNGDKDNRAAGLFYWMEAEGEHYEHNERLENQSQDNQP